MADSEERSKPHPPAEQPVGPGGAERPARDKPVSAPKNEPKTEAVDPDRDQPDAWSTQERKKGD